MAKRKYNRRKNEVEAGNPGAGKSFTGFNPDGGDLGRGDIADNGMSPYQQGYNSGMKHAQYAQEIKNSMRASEKAVIFLGTNESMPVRSASDQLLIANFRNQAEKVAALKADLAVRGKLMESLENEMNYRGLITLTD